jgi:hypothetical protein
MSEIVVTPMEPGTYGVEVTEGTVTTGHRVTVPPDFALELGIPDADEAVLVEETIAFLLDREPAAAIMSEFSLNDVGGFFPEYSEELLTRLSN